MPKAPLKSNSGTGNSPVGGAAATPTALLAGEKPAGILYVADHGYLRRDRFTRRYLQTFVDKNKLQREDFDGRFFSEKDLEVFYGSIRTLSLFAEQKIVFFRYVDDLSANILASIAKEFEKLSTSVHLVFSGTPLPDRSVFKKQIEKFGTYLLFDELKGPELKRWIQKECAHCGITQIDEAGIELLIDISQNATTQSALDTAAAMIERLSLFVDAGKVTARDIQTLFKKHTETSEFLLVDAVLAGDHRKSMTLGSRSLQAGLHPYGFVPLLGKSVSNLMAMMMAVEEKFGVDRLKTALGMNPWVANKLATTAKKIKPTQAMDLTTKLLLADLRLKSKSLHPADIVFDLF